MGRQYLGRYGKTDNGIVTVTTVWADERIYYPVHALPYTPARHFAKGKNDPEFRTKLAIGAELAVRARAAGFMFRAVVADSAYGDQDGFRGELAGAGLPFVMALRPRRGTWARAADAHTPVDAARALAWGGPDDPGDWQPVVRRVPRRARRDLVRRRRDAGRVGTGWRPAPGRGHRRPGHPAGQGHLVPGHEPAPPRRPAREPTARTRPPGWPRSCASTRIRNWIEQSYKQVKDELGWADFQVRSDLAIRRHQALVNCAFSFCWAAWFADHPPQHGSCGYRSQSPAAERGGPHAAVPPPAPSWPRALRAVRAWLSPWTVLQRWWTAWSKAPPPPQLQALISSVAAGRGLHLYIPN